MGAERVKLYKLLVIDGQFDAPATLTFSTGIVTIPFPLAAGPRRPIKLRMPETARGRYAQVTIQPYGTMRLFSLTLYGRRVGESAEANWQWIGGPVDPTPEEWSSHPLPIPPTPEEWTSEALPIPPSAEEWITQRLPIPPSEEEWSLLRVPIPQTPDLPQWAQIPVDR